MESSQLQRMQAEINNLAGLCGALRFLLEVDFANKFAGEPEAFEQVMAKLIRLAQTAGRAGEPANPEDLIEAAAQTAAHLQRFGMLTSARIRADSAG